MGNLWKSSLVWWFLQFLLFGFGTLGFPTSNTSEVPCTGRENCFTPSRMTTKCKCDYDCVTYGDCCYDAEIPAMDGKVRDPRYICIRVGDEEYDTGVYMIDTCPETFDGPEELEQGCLSENRDGDPIMHAPVYDYGKGITYRNKYCAECNDASVFQILSFTTAFDCRELQRMAMNNSNSILHQVDYHEDTKSWGVKVDGEIVPCRIVYNVPRYLLKYVRLCKPDRISSCPSNWTDASVQMRCHSYIASVQTEDGIAFKNVDCATCNGYDSKNVSCNLDVSERAWYHVSFAMLLDVNFRKGNMVGTSLQCEHNETYDPYFKKCRKLFCAFSDYEVINGKCHKKSHQLL